MKAWVFLLPYLVSNSKLFFQKSALHFVQDWQQLTAKKESTLF